MSASDINLVAYKLIQNIDIIEGWANELVEKQGQLQRPSQGEDGNFDGAEVKALLALYEGLTINFATKPSLSLESNLAIIRAAS